ncbi:hypothetical protein HOL21_02770 [Candidatus Woesearchaeota archaeon]|jgi:hypothetical protein|nr:hypothetical protein [Candidatus Woesearchaeota archaeon]MBT5397112.1 hypothetical protein [Candidatus Woesearchaeota archaeon]MBT5924461.1 hypothetical protein [Candidatus Woesearchaeota archaeon]MBT6367342.1 hypothetical protein [Candidatus Woesearchaeota archaeon]MBT7762512.1 hypothetical protein [Candidatus Woesearchaeota archaeon]
MTVTVYNDDATRFYKRETFIKYMNDQGCLEKVNRPTEIKEGLTVTNWFHKEAGECLRYIHHERELREPKARVTVFTNKEKENSQLVKLIENAVSEHKK